jgi:hypothetical protein
VSPRGAHPAALRWWVAILLLVACACSGSPPEDEADAEAPVPVPDESVTEKASVTPLQRNTVEIFFPSLLGDGLIGEYREIFETVTPGDRAKQIVADLIDGPATPEALRAVPQGTVLRQAYVLDDGTAYLDFSPDLTERIGGGSMGEILTIYSIIDSVVANVPEITRVGIMVNGEPIETLNGHIDLRRALKPNFDLVLAPTVVEAQHPPTGPIVAGGTFP